jgi:hypothetical protein
MKPAAGFGGIRLDLSVKESSFQEQLKYLEASQPRGEKFQVCQAYIDPNDLDPEAGDLPMVDGFLPVQMEICDGEIESSTASLGSSTITGFGSSTSTSTASTFGSSTATSTGTFASSATSWATASSSSGGLGHSPLGNIHMSTPTPPLNATTDHSTNPVAASPGNVANGSANMSASSNADTGASTANIWKDLKNDVMTGTGDFCESNMTDTASLISFRNPKFHKALDAQRVTIKARLNAGNEVQLAHTVMLK